MFGAGLKICVKQMESEGPNNSNDSTKQESLSLNQSNSLI